MGKDASFCYLRPTKSLSLDHTFRPYLPLLYYRDYIDKDLGTADAFPAIKTIISGFQLQIGAKWGRFIYRLLLT